MKHTTLDDFKGLDICNDNSFTAYFICFVQWMCGDNGVYREPNKERHVRSNQWQENDRERYYTITEGESSSH